MDLLSARKDFPSANLSRRRRERRWKGLDETHLVYVKTHAVGVWGVLGLLLTLYKGDVAFRLTVAYRVHLLNLFLVISSSA